MSNIERYKGKIIRTKINESPSLLFYIVCDIFCQNNEKQDGRLAPVYFSPNYKYFDQLLQTVKNKTIVLNLDFKEFLQTSIPPLISVLYA